MWWRFSQSLHHSQILVFRGCKITDWVSCLYVNSTTGQFWVIDYRLSCALCSGRVLANRAPLYDPDGDGQNKLDHVAAMLDGVAYTKTLPFRTVLMDGWYAT